MSDEVTIVTSYLNLGTFQKGDPSGRMKMGYHNPAKYLIWMQPYAKIDNPVVAFMDQQKYIDIFNKLRSHLPSNRTKIVLVSTADYWSFSLRSDISTIFSSPGYPTLHPNTVSPDYACAMHAKYDFVADVADTNPF